MNMMKLFVALLFAASLVYAQDEKWLNDCLAAHNDFRASEGKPALQLNDEITDVAQAYANELSSSCSFTHSDSEYGENLDAGSDDCFVTVKRWTDEKPLYDPENPSDASGHYTQVVWKSTTQLGCGIASHCQYGHVVVCNYSPAGNVPGEYKDNV